MFEVHRALVSVSDKRNLIMLAKALQRRDVEIMTTGGTGRELAAAGIDAVEVSSRTGFPEIMDGRVKTLHPSVHGGLLGRRGIDDAVMEEHDIKPIDLLVVNLYPFEETVSRPDVSIGDAIENIDIGGPAMIRAAAKNHSNVAVLVDPDDYGGFFEFLKIGEVSEEYRRNLALKAYVHTASYDTAIARYLSLTLDPTNFGDRILYAGRRVDHLRYGENPHQVAAFFRDQSAKPGTIAYAERLQGRLPSFNNIADSDAALECVRQFTEPACVIVKHANPCGVAIADNILQAYDKAFSTDPTSAFGGIIAFNRRLDGATAASIIDRQFVEVVVAPAVDEDAQAALAKKKNVRVLCTGEPVAADFGPIEFKKVSGGLLVQFSDTGTVSESELTVVTEMQPTDGQVRDLLFAWKVAKFVKSNAIVFCRDGMTVGVGAGQMSRVYSTKIAAIKAQDEGLAVRDSVLASDAFFPFRDGIDSAAEHGISAIIQPGGSLRDDEVIAAANEHGVAMVFTGMRHFRH